MRLGPGPVFAFEWLSTSRRWYFYALRTGFITVILVGMMLVWQSVARSTGPNQVVSIHSLASYGESLYETVVSIELSLVLLAAPAATAGAVCLDKARGTLDHVLATDLSNTEIVLGKLGVRLLLVLGLIACVLPVAALGGLLGGIDPTALLGSFLTAIGCAVVGCSLALTLSIWARKIHEVLVVTYVLLMLWLISPFSVFLVAIVFPLGMPDASARVLVDWLGYSNPYYLVMAPYANPGKVSVMTYLKYLTVCLCISGMLLGWATMRIRRIALNQAGRPAAWSQRRRIGFRWPGWIPHLPVPSLDSNPVLWREWHRASHRDCCTWPGSCTTASGCSGLDCHCNC